MTEPETNRHRRRPRAARRAGSRRALGGGLLVLGATLAVSPGCAGPPDPAEAGGTLAERVSGRGANRADGAAEPGEPRRSAEALADGGDRADDADEDGGSTAPPEATRAAPPTDDAAAGASPEVGAAADASAPDAVAPDPGAPRGRTAPPAPRTLQAGITALGDEIVDLVVVATDRIEDDTTDVDRRRRAHEFKLAVGRTVVNTVAGPSGFAALVDLVTKSSLLARAAEESAPAQFGEQAPILIEALEQARDRAWNAAGRLMLESQYTELREAVAVLPLESTDLVYVTQISLREYVAMEQARMTGSSRQASFNLLSLLRIDPLANLDPATRELEQSRLLGERALYQAQRTGRLLRWEVEGLLYDLLAAPETQNLLRSADRASRSSETLAGTVEALPETLAEQRTAVVADLDALLARQRTALIEDTAAAVARERAAAIDDLRAAVAAEREALREDVAAIEGPLVRTMDSTRATIEEATRMSESLDGTLATFDTVLRRMGVDRTQPQEPREPRDPDRAPFDIAAYGAVATDVGAAAANVTTTLEAFESVLNEPLLKPADAPDGAGGASTGDGRRRPQVPAAVAMEATGRALLDALLIRAAVLVIVAGLTAIGAAWAIQRIRRGGA